MTTANKKQNPNNIHYSLLATNAYHVRTPHIHATGFRTAALKYSERENISNLGEMYLINSFLRRNDPEIDTSISAYLSPDGIKMISLTGLDDTSSCEVLTLPKGSPLDIALGEAIAKRRSVREFTGDPIHKDDLATLLRVTAGVSAKLQVQLSNGDEVQFNLRTVARGVGLYPIELYVVPLTIDGLKKGVYRYQAQDDCLLKLSDQVCLQQLLQSFSGAVDMVKSSHAAAIFLFAAKPWRSMRKYGDRGLRFVFQEVGSMSQNLHLAATALGLGSIDCASFYEEEVNQALQLDGVYQSVIHSTLIGAIV